MEKNAAKIVEYFVSDIVPGMELARDIYSADGMVLISGGTVLSRHTIEKLLNREIQKVHIYQETPVNIFTDTKLQQFMGNYNKSVAVVENAFASMRNQQEISLAELSDAAQQLSEQVADVGNAIDQLYQLPPCDDLTYYHSVNVSVISALLAQWLKLPAESISAIALAGLLHDIGKSQLPVELLHRVDRLLPEQYQQYQQHVLLGEQLTKKMPNLADSIAQAVCQHHERRDGSGYPQGLQGDEIHPYARIVAVADVYDEFLTINRQPDLVLSPYSALEAVRDSLSILDVKAAFVLMDKMSNFLSGNQVVLTDQRVGRVVCINPEFPARSIVQLDDQSVIDLSQTNCRIHYILR